MGCSTCNKSKRINLSKLNYDKGIENLNQGNNEYIFTGRFGRLIYFIILSIVALTPIINLAAIYMFYNAVYGGVKKKNKKDNGEINKDKDNS